MAPPIGYTWCQFKMTSSKYPYRSKHQVIILTVYIYIALKPCTSHKIIMACFSPAHGYTLYQILHIYGVLVVICGGLPTRLGTANHHKPPPKRRKYAVFGTMGIRESIDIVLHSHRHGLATLKDKLLAFYLHTIIPNYGGGLQWFAVV